MKTSYNVTRNNVTLWVEESDTIILVYPFENHSSGCLTVRRNRWFAGEWIMVDTNFGQLPPEHIEQVIAAMEVAKEAVQMKRRNPCQCLYGSLSCSSLSS